MRVKCLAQEHNKVSPARARAQNVRSEDERTNHEATVPPTYRVPRLYDNTTTKQKVVHIVLLWQRCSLILLSSVEREKSDKLYCMISNLCETCFIPLYIIPVNLFHDVTPSKFLISLQVNSKNIETKDGIEKPTYLTSDN